MVGSYVSRRWRIRAVGLPLLALVALLTHPLASPQAEPDSLSAVERARAAWNPGEVECRLTNESYGPGQRMLVGEVGTTLNEAIRIRVLDLEGNELPGVPVHFELVTVPKGVDDAAISETVVTDEAGVAAADVKLGRRDGSYLVAARSPNMVGEMPQVRVTSLKPTWWLFVTFGLVGGLGLFLYGMELGSSGLQKVAGSRMRSILGALTTNRFMGLVLGTIVTALVQSSSATTVMVVGFVSAGLMTLIQSLGVIMGANIGTTVTVQLIAFKITDYALLMIGAGFVTTVVTRRKTYVYLGEIVLGFGMIFYGMAIMSEAMSPLRGMPVFSNALLSLGDRPFLGIMAAAVFTGLIQSSGATIGLAVVLAGEGLLDLSAAMPIVLGVLVLYPLLAWYVPAIEELTRMMGSVSIPREVANGHMVFNIAVALLFMPFLKPLAWLVHKVVPEEEEKVEPEFKPKYLNNDLLETPEMALASAYQELLRASDIIGEMISVSLDAFHPTKGEDAREKMRHDQDVSDALCEEMRRYYIRLSQKDLGFMQSREKQGHMSIMDDFRQMGQLIGVDILGSATALAEKNAYFSEQGDAELREYLDFTVDTHDATEEAMRRLDVQLAKAIRKRKDDGEEFERRLRTTHLERLDEGLRESAETSSAHMDYLTALRQLGRHHFRICRILSEALTPPE